MPQSRPYQPALLRLLHGTVAALTVGALITGFWVYDTYDKRWGSLALPKLADIQGIHGTIALTFLLVLPVFALYSFHLGDRRLVQARSLQQLQQFGQPAGWVAIHRLANTLMLLAATGAVITGRMMQEAWLPAGEVNRLWYLAHLATWAGLLVSLVLHLLTGAKVGGVPLLASMFQWQMRAEDRPRSWLRGWQFHRANLLLKLIEGIVMVGIVLAFVLPVFTS